MMRNRATLLEDGTERSAPMVRGEILAWAIIGLLVFLNIVGFVLDRAATP